jgi:hypothetical protein
MFNNSDPIVQAEIVKAVAAILTSIIAIAGTYVGIKKKIKRNSNDEESSDKLKLIYHPTFTRIEYNKNEIRNCFELKNKGKEILFKEIIIKHLDIYKIYLKEFVIYIDNNTCIDYNELENRSIEVLNKIINELNCFYISDNSYSSEEKKVLEIVLDKYQLWNNHRQNIAVEMIKNVCGSVFYPSVYSKSVTILDVFLFLVTDAVDEAEKTLNGLNGDLRGLVFRGIMI